MKAILVIDMPTCCEDCPCMNWASYEDEILCGALGEELFVNDKEEVIKSKRCPLRELPDYEINTDKANQYHQRFCNGWNAMIDYCLNKEDEEE